MSYESIASGATHEKTKTQHELAVFVINNGKQPHLLTKHIIMNGAARDRHIDEHNIQNQRIDCPVSLTHFVCESLGAFYLFVFALLVC